MTTLTATKCKAKNPATCPYHGSLEVHQGQLQDATAHYITVLRNNLSSVSLGGPNGKDNSANHAQFLADAKEKMDAAQASVDSHDDEYNKIVDGVDLLEENMEDDEPMDSIKDLYKTLKDRKSRADAVRVKNGKPTRSSILEEQAELQNERFASQDQFDAGYETIYPNGETEGDLWEEEDLEREGISKDSKNLWTIVDVDGEMYITAGYHYVNRMGYMVTDNEWKSESEEYAW